MARKIVAFILLLAGLAYFIARDRQAPRATETGATAEDVLIGMVEAMGKGDVAAWLDCFGGELRGRLETLVRQLGNQELAAQLKARHQPMKGFAILEKQPQGNDRLVVSTETVYADKNARQTFVLQRQSVSWKIVASDSEMVSQWETNFGKSIRE